MNNYTVIWDLFQGTPRVLAIFEGHLEELSFKSNPLYIRANNIEDAEKISIRMLVDRMLGL